MGSSEEVIFFPARRERKRARSLSRGFGTCVFPNDRSPTMTLATCSGWTVRKGKRNVSKIDDLVNQQEKNRKKKGRKEEKKEQEGEGRKIKIKKKRINE